MREIKFRAWDMDEKKMIYPTLHHNEKYVMQLNCSYIGEFNGKTYDTVKMPIMQFTGLKDKNGKEIYEGDVISYTDVYSKIIQTITFHAGKFIASNRNRPAEYGWLSDNGHSYDLCFIISLGSYEVIGNIYENPDLLCK